ncbi:unnamed protein product [Adineta steineri]|uniref:TIR domain-containing protein n=1 Tax=Adineta steineri TaxID=433720 RepID=A0A819BJW4_9BILA|nr:unnamed protein product [Adineta steineri]
MDTTESDQLQLLTSIPTPMSNEINTTQDDSDSDILFSSMNEEQNHNYSSCNNACESENESDSTDEQPSEAIDDSILPNELQKDPTEKSFDKSFHPQPSQERDDIRSPAQDTELSVGTYLSTLTDTDHPYEIQSTGAVPIFFEESYPMPCSDDKDAISIIKQQLTTTTTTTTTEYIETKKHKNDLGHIMISYNHSTKILCSKIAKALKNMNYIVWIDQDDISGNIFGAMAQAVENSFVVLMAINEQYYQSRYCRLEAEYSVELNKASIPMLMQPDYKALGWLGIINGSKLHIDFSKHAFDEAFNALVREIESVRSSLGADRHDRTSISTSVHDNQLMTTMNNHWTSFQNVNEWNVDDVVEWLNREKLQMFEDSLRNFTGATLWQLYKVKFDSPTDYYRMVESLLPPTCLVRLLHNLTFNGALESLFSSSNSKTKYL